MQVFDITGLEYVQDYFQQTTGQRTVSSRFCISELADPLCRGSAGDPQRGDQWGAEPQGAAAPPGTRGASSKPLRGLTRRRVGKARC